MITLPAPRALLFDLDGTLVDSVADLAASANVTRAHFGLPPLDEPTVASYVGDGATRLLERSLSDLRSGFDLREAVGVFRDHYLDHCLDRTQPFLGVLDTLEALADRPLAVVTNKPQPMAERIADGLGLRPPVDVVVGARDDLPVKPDPALLRVALRELGQDEKGGSSVWMIGDSRNDVLSGQAIGATTLAVSHGLGDLRELAELRVTHVLASFADLVGLVEAAEV